MIDTFIVVLPLMLSPGPANLVSFVLGARTGFSRILPFQLGIVVVYGVVAFVLGSLTTRVSAVSPLAVYVLQALGGVFIVYLGLQLIFRKNREAAGKAPTFGNGIMLQALNPKYPGVVLAVFANRQGETALATTAILLLVGTIALLGYSLAGSLFHARAISGSGFRALDRTAGVLLCLVGLWFAIQPLLG